MEKPVLVLAVGLLAVAMLTTPVLAAPTNGQKVPAILKFPTPPKVSILDPGERTWTNGNVTHLRDRIINYTFLLIIDGAPPITGYAITVRDGSGIPYKIGMTGYHDYYEFWFPTEGGGFEGRALNHITDATSEISYNLSLHTVLHGTGAFEGQTLNMWREGPLLPGGWFGYLLKP